MDKLTNVDRIFCSYLDSSYVKSVNDFLDGLHVGTRSCGERKNTKTRSMLAKELDDLDVGIAPSGFVSFVDNQ